MAKKEKKISINKLESVMYPTTVTIPLGDEEGTEVTVRKVLPFKEMLQFVEDVVSACIDGETGRYIPEAKDLCICNGLLTRYANCNLPENIEKQYDLMYGTDLVRRIREVIDVNQYFEIMDAIDERISHELRLSESTLASQVAELLDKINDFVDQSNNMFGDISGEDMAQVAKNLAQIDVLDEEKLARAVLGVKESEVDNVTELPVE